MDAGEANEAAGLDRRRWLAGGLAAGAAAALGGRAAALTTGDLVWEVGQTAAAYQALFDRMAARRWRPTHIDAWSLGGSPRFAAIFVPSDGRDWQARHDLTLTAYRALDAEMAAKGFRPTRVRGYEKNGQLRFAALWDRSHGPAREAHVEMSRAEHQATFDRLLAAGWHPVSVAGYAVAGVTRFASIYEARRPAGFESWNELDAAAFQAKFNALNARGYGPDRVNIYPNGGVPMFGAIWRPTTARWQCRHNLTEEGLLQADAGLRAQGYSLADVAGCEAGGASRYIALWR